MAEDPAPARDDSDSFSNFRVTAQSAGAKLKDAMQKGLPPARDTPAYSFFDIKSFDFKTSDGYSNLLKELMDRFEEKVNMMITEYCLDGQLIHFQEFRRLHPVGTLEWRKVMVIREGTSIDENRFRDREEDPWLLALFAKDKTKIGRNYSLHSSFRVDHGDVFLGYEVVRA